MLSSDVVQSYLDFLNKKRTLVLMYVVQMLSGFQNANKTHCKDAIKVATVDTAMNECGLAKTDCSVKMFFGNV